MNLKTQIPVYYDDIEGWLVLSDESLSGPQLAGLASFVMRVNSQRAKDMKGEKRKRVDTALERLRTEGLRILSTKPGITMFQSSERVTNTSYHFMGR